jgi:hypothetical protein
MSPIDTLLAIRTAGGTAAIDDGRLVVDIEVDLPETVWQAVAEHRDEIVRLLAPAAPPPAVTVEDRQRWIADPASVSPADRQRWAEDVHARHPHHRGLEAVVEEVEAFVADHKPLPPCWEDPFDCPRHRGSHDLPAGVECCDRCGATETVSSPACGGASTRQDCARCGRFRKFSIWYGRPTP